MPTELPPRPFDSPRPISPSAAVAIPSFLARVYVWMAAGLLVTAGCAFVTLSNESVLKLVFGNRFVFFGLMIAELGLVAWLSGLVGRLSSTAAGAVFLLYSALNGLTLSVVFLAYTSASIVSTFVVTAGMFGAMSVYGLVTKRALDGLGSFAFMGLIGVILASVVNIFLKNDMLGFVLSCAGVDRLHRAHGVRHEEAQDDGDGRGRRLGRGQARLDLRRPRPLPRLHQPLPDAPPVLREPR